MGVSQIAKLTDVSRATNYRVLQGLESQNWLRSEGRPKRFFPSLRVVQLGLLALRQLRPRDILLPSAIDLARVTGRTATIGFYEKGEVLFTDSIQAFGERVISLLPGSRAPANVTAAGKILLAFQSDNEVSAVIARGLTRVTPHSISEPDDLLAELAACRRRRYATSEGEYTPGTAGIAVPVFDAAETAVAALGLNVAFPISAETLEKIVPMLQSYSAKASSELGFRSRALDLLT